MTCIYCGAEAASEEHPLPRCLGNFKGFIPLLNRICVRCNALCGQLDEQLCRSGQEAFFRRHLKISGRAEHVEVNPFYRGSSGGGRLEMVGTNQQTGEDKEIELVGPGEIRELRCIKLVAQDGSAHTITIPDGMKPSDFRARVTALGIPSYKQAEICAPIEEREWIESLLEPFSKQKPEWFQPEGPVTYGPFTIKFTVTDRYFRAIAKIGFHYFLTKFHRFRGDEPCFSATRNFILKDCPLDRIPEFVTYSRIQFVQQLRWGDRLRVWGHVLAAESDYVGLRAKVQLFVGPENRSIVYTVRIGQNPSRIHAQEAYADFFAYYPAEERAELDGEVSEMRIVGALS